MPRELAFKILRSKSATPLREVDRVAKKHDLSGRDRGFLRAIIGTEVRRRATLRAVAQKFAHGKLSPELSTNLRLGILQILFMDDVPDHAAVSESVRTTVNTVGMSKGRVVNGILRNVIRARVDGHTGDPTRDLVGTLWHLDLQVFPDPEEHPLLWGESALSMPAPLLKRWTKRFGSRPAFDLARDALEIPDLSVRPVGIAIDELVRELEALDIEVLTGGHENVLRLAPTSAEKLFSSDAFAAGRFTLQGATAHAAARLVEARPGERILDLCAAPGGKTLVLAEAGAKVTACDVHPGKLERITENLARYGHNELVEVVEIAADGSDIESRLNADFDAALVDAPCSNTGVLGARPAARWRFGPANQKSLHELQDSLLDRAASRLRPTGPVRLIYSTCSLESDENEQRARAFLERHPEFKLDVEHHGVPSRVPGEPVDGGYAVRFIRG